MWVQIGSWNGEQDRRTESFHVISKEWRLRWQAARTSLFPKFRVAVYEAASEALVKRVISGYGQATTEVRLTPGRYYLRVNAARVVWTIAVEDWQP